MKLKQKARTAAHRLPAVLALLLAALTTVGVVRVYALGGQALASMTVAERRAISTTVDITAQDYNANTRPDRYSVYGSISTSDGVALFGPTVDQSGLSPAFASLIGLVGEDNSARTRYVAANYLDQLLPDIDYSPLTGIPAGAAPELTLTISSAVQEGMYTWLTERGVQGCVFAYDYVGGDILCMASTPGAHWRDTAALEGSYLNKNLYNTTPGSTMKLVTLLLLLQQGFDPAELTFSCQGSYTLRADGEAVRCTGMHGTLDGANALGRSCNCWFAQAIEQLDPAQAAADLKEMGCQVNGNELSTLGAIPRSSTCVTLGTAWDFDSVWSLIGQGATLVSPIDMAVLAGQCAAGGGAALPRLLAGQETELSRFGQSHPELFQRLGALWRQAYGDCYPVEDYSGAITAAKTGTADELGAEGERTQKLLCGCSQELHTAFYVVIENAQTGDDALEVTTAEVANRLMELLSAL